MSFPWQGKARGRSPSALRQAADRLGCEEAAIAAVWEVEAAGRGFRADGTLERRFEPHHMPGATSSWRDSLRIGRARRDAMMEAAFGRQPEATLRASSFGAPQIMGFNAEACGFLSASAMVEAMADSEDAQVEAFVALIEDWGIATHLRSHDWVAFARRYNGSGQAEVYGGRIARAYRRHAGKPSDTVLRRGMRGDAVRALQEALGLAEHEVDGIFGPATEAELREFQRRAGLQVDGIAGNRTWEALRTRSPERAPMVTPRADEEGLPTREAAKEPGWWGKAAERLGLPTAGFSLAGVLRELVGAEGAGPIQWALSGVIVVVVVVAGIGVVLHLRRRWA